MNIDFVSRIGFFCFRLGMLGDGGSKPRMGLVKRSVPPTQSPDDDDESTTFSQISKLLEKLSCDSWTSLSYPKKLEATFHRTN